MNKLVLASASLLATGVLLAPPVHADVPGTAAKKADTKVKIAGFKLGSETTVTFVGTVKSPKASCEKGRKVVLRQTDQDIKVGTDKTNEKGRWSITFDQTAAGPGNYKATVSATRRCQGDSDRFDTQETRTLWVS